MERRKQGMGRRKLQKSEIFPPLDKTTFTFLSNMTVSMRFFSFFPSLLSNSLSFYLFIHSSLAEI